MGTLPGSYQPRRPTLNPWGLALPAPPRASAGPLFRAEVLAGKPKGATNADPERIQTALSAWIRLGSSKAAARETKVSASTLRTWKERDPDLWDSLRQAHACELHERHTANVRTAWEDFAWAAQKAAAMLRGGEHEAKDFRALAGTIGDYCRSADHAMRLDAGGPTSIREDRRTDAEALAQLELAAERAGVSIDMPEIDPAAVTHTGERH